MQVLSILSIKRANNEPIEKKRCVYLTHVLVQNSSLEDAELNCPRTARCVANHETNIEASCDTKHKDAEQLLYFDDLHHESLFKIKFCTIEDIACYWLVTDTSVKNKSTKILRKK